MNYKHFGDYVSSFDSFGDRLALTARPFLKIERLSYANLQKRSYQAAHYLIDQGVARGNRVMVIANNSPQWLELFFGTQLIGAILVTVDARNSLKSTLGFIKQTSPKHIFKSSYLLAELNKHAKTSSLDDFDKLIDKYSASAPTKHLDGSYPSVIVFTSGTTADPKGVVLSQANILANISGIQQKIDLSPNWRLLSVLPLSHMYELTGSLAVLSCGASIFYVPRITPQAIAKALLDYKITTILAIPQLLTLLLERIQQTAREEGKAKTLATAFKIAGVLPFPLRRVLFHSVHARLGDHLDLVVTGGAPIPLEVAKSWEKMGVRMVQGYGLTETSPILTVNGLTQRRLDSPGQPLDNVGLRIAGEGEIQAKGPSIFAQYWDNPSATKDAFTSDGWFKTGDVGHLENNWLQIQGRLKFAIVLSSGLKVFPEDIELVAAKRRGFKDICIVGVQQPDGESVVAVVVSDKSDSEIQQSIDDINAETESFQHIAKWLRWPDSDFPRTRLLKIDRKLVQAWANTNAKSHQADEVEGSSAEDQIVDIIRLSLDNPKTKISDSDHLADIGLDSLRRLNVVALIEGRMGITIPEEEVTNTSTVVDLRKLVDKGSQAEASYYLPTWPFNRLIRFIGNGARECLIFPIVRIWVKPTVKGRGTLNDLSGPAIFIFNHSDDFDGPVVYRTLPHQVRKHLSVAAANDVMVEHKVLSFIIRFCFAGFNFARHEPYMPSLQYIGEMIDRGWGIVIAPEGHLSPDGQLQPFKDGIGLLATSLGVPIVPIKTFGLSGTVPVHARWPKKHSRVTVRIGQPMIFDDSMDYYEVTEKLHSAMKELQP